MQKIEITKKSKMKARKRRKNNESKWVLYRIITLILILICSISFIVGIYVAGGTNYELINNSGVIFSITLILAVIAKSLLLNFTSRLIHDRLNERLWIESEHLYHFMQTGWGAGLNTNVADETAYLFVMDIATIQNARYDDKSGRIEFTVSGKGYHYSDHRRDIIDKSWPLEGFKAIFYDATQPSLYEVLKEHGVKFQICTINYKFTNQI